MTCKICIEKYGVDVGGSTARSFVRHMKKVHDVVIRAEDISKIAARELAKMIQQHMNDSNLTTEQREQCVSLLEEFRRAAR